MEAELQRIRDEYQDVIGKPVDITEKYASVTPTWCEAILDQMRLTKDDAEEESKGNKAKGAKGKKSPDQAKKAAEPRRKMTPWEQADEYARKQNRTGQVIKDVSFDIDFRDMSSQEIEAFVKYIKSIGIRDMKLFAHLTRVIDQKGFQEKHFKRKKKMELNLLRSNAQ